jgi:hypothetical protein
MREEILEKTIVETYRFLEIAIRAKKRLKEDKMAYLTGSKETGACRRSSMDLTRVLAESRKPQ